MNFLPPITALPGQIIPERPLQMKKSTCSNYICMGEAAELAELCTTWFNAPMIRNGKPLRIEPYSNVVLISYILHPYANLVNEAGKVVAYYSFKELKYSFMVRATLGEQEIGKFMFVPIKFVSRGAPMAWERQVYGIPAVKARISETIEGNKIYIQCDAFGIKEFSPDSRAKVLRVINTDAAPTQLGTIGKLHQEKMKVLGKLEATLKGRAPEDLPALILPFQQNEFVALREFLSTSDPRAAIFEDILTYRMNDLNLSSFAWLGDDFEMEFPEVKGTFELVSKMIDKPSLKHVCAYQYIYDFTLGPGRILSALG